MKKLFLSLSFITLVACGIAQNVSINDNGAAPDPSAVLDVQGFLKGLLIPRMSSFERQIILNPAEGLIVYDTTSNSFWYFDSFWNELGAGTDNQQLTLVGDQLSIESGNTVTIPAGGSISDDDGDTFIEFDDGTDPDHIELFIGNSSNPKIRFTQNSIEFLHNSTIKIGENAGENSVTGVANVMIGEEAGNAMVGNSYNTLVGHQAGRQSQGNANTFLGSESGELSTSGNSNTYLGDRSGFNSDGGSSNVLVGANSGTALTNGSGNVMIGRNAGPTSNANDMLYIDNSQTNTPLIQGDFSANELQINGKLNINGEFDLPTTDGAPGEVLATDGSGNLAWAAADAADDQQLALSGTSLSIDNGNSVDLPIRDVIQDGDEDTKIRVDDGLDSDKIEFFVGESTSPKATILSDRLELHSGNNMIIAEGASTNVSGEDNTIIGQQSGQQFTSGDRNTLVGSNSGAALTSGFGNTYLGYVTGSQNQTGLYNTLIGSQAGATATGTSNTYIGSWAGRDASTGYGNILMGDWTGGSLSTGSQNTILGTGAGGVTTGNGNVIIGYNARPASPGSEQLIIDNNDEGTPLIYGEFDNQIVRVNGTLNINGVYDLPAGPGTDGQVLKTNNLGELEWEDFADSAPQTLSVSGDFLSISNGNSVDISTPSQTLSLVGTALTISDGNTVDIATTSPFENSGNTIAPITGHGTDDFVFGSPNIDNIIDTNWHTRFQFDHSLSAFRAGKATSNEWSEANTGQYSFAAGLDNTAQGYAANAFGQSNNASGPLSSCFGSNLETESNLDFAIGKFNIGGGNVFWSSSDPIFEVGVGSNDLNRANAFTVLKNGKIFLGTFSSFDGIGTGYDVVMDGKLLCEEVRVQDSGNWPDYVFAPEHTRLSFQELRLYLDKNHHLPGVPSAEEVNGNGFELAEMNEVLLEKIEELYLYVLELEEEVSNLKE